MADPRFFDRAGPFTLAELARTSGARLWRAADSDKLLHDVAPLETAGADDVSFLENRKYLAAFRASRAGAAFVDPEMAKAAPPAMALLVTEEPYKAYAVAAQAFYPTAPVAPGSAPSAVVDPEATVPEDCEIGPNVVIEARARLGRRCQIGANSVLGAGVIVGDDCRIGANVTVSHALIGARVVLHPGVRIGQAGFGFAPDPAGPVKVPQLGRVVIGDDVDIGANTTIDRGTLGDTEIGAGTVIDNLVQIGHNVKIGRHCILVSQVGISGSTVLEDYVVLGGQVGLSDHLKLGQGARVAAKSGVMRDVEPGIEIAGIPAVPVRQWHRQTAALARLSKGKGG